MSGKVGRPKKPKAEALAPGISVRLTAGEGKRVAGAVTKSGLSKSDWARKCLLWIIDRDIRIT
jgi:hypothetical protein